MPAKRDLIRLDRRRRPQMVFGPLWWWVIGIFAIAAVNAVVVLALESRGDDSWRVVAIVGGALVFAVGAAYTFAGLRRQRRYREELAAKGWQHRVPVHEEL